MAAGWWRVLALAVAASASAAVGAEQTTVGDDSRGGMAHEMAGLSYRLPESTRSSVYFLPGSADLHESALAAIAAAAARLRADGALSIRVEGHAEVREEAMADDELSGDRARVVREALVANGVPRQRISVVADGDDEAASAACTSEYCRQSYRRAALRFSTAADR